MWTTARSHAVCDFVVMNDFNVGYLKETFISQLLWPKVVISCDKTAVGLAFLNSFILYWNGRTEINVCVN